MRSVDKAPSKQPYQPPKLSIYGDLAEITRSGGPKGQPDMLNGNSMT
jgi:hypothetical protein